MTKFDLTRKKILSLSSHQRMASKTSVDTPHDPDTGYGGIIYGVLETLPHDPDECTSPEDPDDHRFHDHSFPRTQLCWHVLESPDAENW